MTDLAFFRATMPESSALATGADDALKDLDNTWFLRGQPDDVRAAWFERIRILRLVDRLAEHDRQHPGSVHFTEFCRQWYLCKGTGLTWGSAPFAVEAEAAVRLWPGDATDTWTTCAMSGFLNGLSTYSLKALPVREMSGHEWMLWLCSGYMFQLFPYVDDERRVAIGHLGALDGFYNNLRDLAEDSAAGLCYFPTDVLERHSLTRDDVLTGRCIGTVGWEQMMRFWLDDYLPTLRNAAQPFIDATGLHPSLEAMREWSLHRYRRVERCFREVGFDYKAFHAMYWGDVRRELCGEEAA